MSVKGYNEFALSLSRYFVKVLESSKDLEEAKGAAKAFLLVNEEALGKVQDSNENLLSYLNMEQIDKFIDVLDKFVAEEFPE